MKYLLFFIAPLLLVNCTTREDLNASAEPVAAAKVNVVVDESRVLFGPKTAPVTIVKYADFQCPACSMDVSSLEEIKAKYGDQVRLIHKAVPLEHIHPQARLAAQVYEALLIQDKSKAQKFYQQAYKEAHNWSDDKDIWKIVKKVGGDPAKITAEIKKGEINTRIQADLKEHQELGFRGTPAYMINGRSLYGAQSFASLSEAVDAGLKKD
jgi:protein-disulfide isomerase